MLGVQQSELPTWIEQGRALLDAGKPAEAEALFARAAAADGGSFATRLWVLRARMDQGRSDETLAALDTLEHAGERGIEMTYLYGMAFARRAEGYLEEGVTDSSVHMNFVDATNFLKTALEADAARFRDAWVPLARAAHAVAELDTARWAGDGAVAALPAEPQAWYARGRVAFAQFIAAETAQAGSPEAEKLWTEATTSLARAVELWVGGPASAHATERAQTELATAATELAHAQLWRQKAVEATDAYATAVGWDPLGVDYVEALQLLDAAPKAEPGDERPRGFRAAVELGKTRFDAHAAADDPRTPTLLWWLGWARFRDADWAGSEAAFQSAVARSSEMANAWFYVGLARQYRKDSEGALAAMHAGWDAAPDAMVTAIVGMQGSLRAFEDLLGWCATQEPARNREAAFLSEMLTSSLPREPRYWNNLGLFLRDEGEQLEIDAYKNKTPEPDKALLSDLYNRSYDAYQRALELAPDDPQLLNDTGLMLHYHLGPDLVKAEEMYRRAIALAEQRLEDPALTAADRERFTATRDDATKNLDVLLHPEKYEHEDAAGADGKTTGETAGETAEAAATNGGGG